MARSQLPLILLVGSGGVQASPAVPDNFSVFMVSFVCCWCFTRKVAGTFMVFEQYKPSLTGPVMMVCPFCEEEGQGGEIRVDPEGCARQRRKSARCQDLFYGVANQPIIQFIHEGRISEPCRHIVQMWGEICDKDSDWEWVTDYWSPVFRKDGIYELADHFYFEEYIFEDFATSKMLRVPNQGLRGYLTWSVPLDDGPHEYWWTSTFVFAQDVAKFNDELGLCYARQLADAVWKQAEART